MAQILTGGLPVEVDIGGGFILQVAALDPTTGNAVAGVKVSNFTIEVKALGKFPLDLLEVGPFFLIPEGPEP
jgi:hypothetical protein